MVTDLCRIVYRAFLQKEITLSSVSLMHSLSSNVMILCRYGCIDPTHP